MLSIAGRASEAIGVDINPFAIRLAQINAKLNSVSNVDFRCGDLWSAVEADLSFDFVCANPPLVPVAKDVDFPLVGAGGEDGMVITWRILEGLPERLRDRGIFASLGVTLSDGIAPLCVDRLQEYSDDTGLGVRLFVVRHFPANIGHEMFDSMVESYYYADNLPLDVGRKKLLDLLDQNGASHFVTYYLTVVRGETDFRVIDFDALETRNLWNISMRNSLDKLQLSI